MEIGIKGYIAYRNDLFKQFKMKSRLRLLSMILVNLAKKYSVGSSVYVSKKTLNDHLRLKRDGKFQTLNRTMMKLEDIGFIEITENDNSYKGKEFFKYKIIPDIDTKKGQRTPFCQVPLNILSDTKNITDNEIIVLSALFYERDGIQNSISQSELKSLCGLSINPMKKAIKSLREKGLIKWEGGRGTRNPFIIGEVRGRKEIFFYQLYRAPQNVTRSEVVLDNLSNGTKIENDKYSSNTNKELSSEELESNTNIVSKDKRILKKPLRRIKTESTTKVKTIDELTVVHKDGHRKKGSISL